MTGTPYVMHNGERIWPDEVLDEELGFWRKDGTPTDESLIPALSCYCYPREPVKIKELAEVFKVPSLRILEAIDAHPWLFAIGPDDAPVEDLTVECEGE